jgi:hypothetical protein
MADYEVIWELDDNRLPIISDELADYIMDKGEYDEFSCPNSFVSRKGREPGRATLVVPYSVMTAISGGDVPTCTLKITYTRLNDEAEVPTQEFEIEMIFDKVVEVFNRDLTASDDDLCIVELVDYRHLLTIGKDHARVDTPTNEGVLEVRGSNIAAELWSQQEGPVFFGGTALDITNQFLPESGTGGEQFLTKVVGSYDSFFQEVVWRTENIFFVDKDGSPVVQKLSHTDSSVATTLSTYIDECESTETLEFDVKNKVRFPTALKAYFWESEDKTSLTSNFNGTITFAEDWGKPWSVSAQAIYPVTSPSVGSSLSTIRQAVADAYGTEVSAQTAIKPQSYVINGNIDFEWKSEITTIGYTNNPFGVTTFVEIEPRHGVPFWEIPTSRLTGGSIRIEAANITWEPGAVTTSTTTAEEDLPVADTEYTSSEVFEFFNNYLCLKKPGLYAIDAPFSMLETNGGAYQSSLFQIDDNSATTQTFISYILHRVQNKILLADIAEPNPWVNGFTLSSCNWDFRYPNSIGNAVNHYETFTHSRVFYLSQEVIDAVAQGPGPAVKNITQHTAFSGTGSFTIYPRNPSVTDLPKTTVKYYGDYDSSSFIGWTDVQIPTAGTGGPISSPSP